MNPTIDLLKAHRSIRQFQNRRIQPDLFEDLIKAGQAAASSNFFQAATIIRVTDRQKRSKLASLANNQGAGCTWTLSGRVQSSSKVKQPTSLRVPLFNGSSPKDAQ